jgi:long-subunit fatty acid transport protein
MNKKNLFCKVMGIGKKVLPFYLFTFLPLSMLAQERSVTLDTYIGAQLATEDLNGTARYVGMGGAMEALGADISTIGTNPAGIGLFRRSQVSGSFGLVIQSDGKSFGDGSKTSASFDQIGFVYSQRTGMSSFINMAFNFHKNRNFNHVLSAVNAAVNGSSQNRQTTIKAITGDLEAYPFGENAVDNLYLESRMIDDGSGYVYTVDADGYIFNRAQTGYIGEYDINLSGNINNRVYLGLTVGFKDVHYDSYTVYEEALASYFDPNMNYVMMTDNHEITGAGYDFKAGIIVRPIEESPFRLGLSVASPTFYKLTTKNYSTILYDETNNGIVYTKTADTNDKADFRFNTPWKFGLSAGHTINNELALGVSYEYADYSTNDMRVITGTGYDWYGDYYDNSDSDPLMKAHTKRTLKGVSTIKAGAEYKIDKNVAVRVGYNYVSPMYKTDGVRDLTLNSPGAYMASTTDYTNWKSTNRITAGVGLTFDQFRVDLAYQYQMREGDFYPYMNGISGNYISDETGQMMTLTNQCNPVTVKDNRHQLLCSLTYSF